MNKKIYVLAFALLFSASSVFSQYKTDIQSHSYLKTYSQNFSGISVAPASISLGFLGGLSRFEGNSGLNVGFFAEIKTESFSFVPQANYWKTDDMNNFEMAGLIRMKFKTGVVEPYVDGGIGINFLNTKSDGRNDTKVGLDLGGGVEFSTPGSNYTIFGDAKYKIIVGDPNIKGVTLSAGVKFTL
jgi:hypothetical protein